MDTIDMTRLVIYRSNIEEEDMDVAKEALEEEYPDWQLSDSDVANRAAEDNEAWLSDERRNLDIPLQNEVIAIARLGLWDNKRPMAYQRMGHNVNAILSLHSDGDVIFYADSVSQEVRCDNSHHDGTNLIRFREMRENVDVESFLLLIFNQKATEEDIEKYTRSLYPYVAKVYGWPLNV